MALPKLIVIYVTLLSLLVIGFVYPFYTNNKQNSKNSAVLALDRITVSTMVELESTIKSLDSIMVSILTSQSFLSYVNEWNSSEAVLPELQQSLTTSFTVNQQYKNDIFQVVLANVKGGMISYGYTNLERDDILELLKSERFHSPSQYRRKIIPPHINPWVKNDTKEVVTLMRTIHSDNKAIAYLEIQTPLDEIEKICASSWNGQPLFYAIIDDNNNVFFSNFPEDTSDEWTRTVQEHALWYPRNTIDTGSEFISIAASDYLSWKIAYVLPQENVFAEINSMRNMLTIGLCVLLAVSSVFIAVYSKHQKKPLEQLVSQIEDLKFSSLQDELAVIYGSREILIIQNSILSMRTRLTSSLEREKALEVLQSRAIYDALQSRIDPHFLYNTLGSIANLCILEEAIDAADACYKLSHMLRYYGQYADKVVTLQNELDSLDYYLPLLKIRYRHRLTYEVHQDKSLSQLKMPKFTLQPLVENAIQYSLQSQEKTYVIVSVFKRFDSAFISVEDNGKGFSPEEIAKIKQKVKKIIEQPSEFSWEDNMVFGGMGLTGTLVRLHLFYGEGFSYEITSDPYRKVTVLLSISLKKGE